MATANAGAPAAAPPAPIAIPADIRACINRRTGAMRGVAGPTGPAGAVGSTGPAPTLTAKSAAIGTMSSHSLTCDGGGTAIGGTWVLAAGEAENVLASQRDGIDPTQWDFTFTNTLTVGATVTVFCVEAAAP